jgi:hypothetical protein
MRPRDSQIGAQIDIHMYAVPRTPENYGFDQSVEDLLVPSTMIADTHKASFA